MAKKNHLGAIANRGTNSIYDGGLELNVDELSILDQVDNPDDLGYAALTTTGINFRRDISHEEWQDLGKYIRQRVDGYQWAIGDFINAGKEEWGSYYAEASEITNYSESSLRKFSMVAAGFDLFRRRNNLTYSHHIEALTTDDPDRWLDFAEQENLTVRALREAINQHSHLPSGNSSPVAKYDKWSQQSEDRAAKVVSYTRSTKSKKTRDAWEQYVRDEILRWQRVLAEISEE